MLGQRPEVAARLVPRQAGPCIFSTGVRPQRARRLLARADTSPQTRLSIASEREKAAEDGEDAPQSSSSQDDFTQEQGGVLAANPLAKFWGGYVERVETDPVPTKAVTSFLGFVIGDILAQRIEGRAYNVFRTLRLGTYGLSLDGPVGHWWYKVLDRTVEPDNPRSTKAVVIKTAADQLIWAPVMTCVFFAVLKSLEGHPELIWPTIQDKLIKTVAANYVIWPAAHFINFRFVPTDQRILYNNCVSVVWTAWLSLVSHDPCPSSFSSVPELWQYCVCILQEWRASF